MFKNKICYNIIWDFFHSIIIVAHWEKIKDIKKRNNTSYLKTNRDIDKYVVNVREHMDAFMKQEMDFLFSQFLGLFMVFYEYAEKSNTIEECLSIIKAMSGEDLLRGYLKRIRIDKDIYDDKDELGTLIDQNPTNSIECNNAEMFMIFREYPDEMKRRCDRFLERYYHQYFQPVEEDINSFMLKEAQKHQALYEQDQEEFIKNVIWYEDKAELKNEKNVYIRMMYFSQFGQALIELEDGYYHYYGYSLAQKLDKDMKTRQNIELFKILSDPKRVEVLKLLSQKKWYNKELAAKCKLTTATMSYHLTKIIELNLVKIEWVEHNKVYYRLDKETLIQKVNEAIKDITDND